MLAFTAGVSLLTGLVFGLAPALQGSRADLVTELKDRTSAPSGHRWYGARNLLVMAQVALSFVALASAGMFLRSLANARGIDPGFDGSRLAVLGINPGTQGFDEARTRELYRRVTERMSGVAGVEAVTLATSVPLFDGGIRAHRVPRRAGSEGSAQRAHDADESGGRRLLRGDGHSGREGAWHHLH